MRERHRVNQLSLLSSRTERSFCKILLLEPGRRHKAQGLLDDHIIVSRMRHDPRGTWRYSGLTRQRTDKFPFCPGNLEKEPYHVIAPRRGIHTLTAACSSSNTTTTTNLHRLRQIRAWALGDQSTSALVHPKPLTAISVLSLISASLDLHPMLSTSAPPNWL